MKKLSILLLLLTSSVFAQSERANITDGGSICEDKNNNQYRSIDSLNGQVSQITSEIDLNYRFSNNQINSICQAIRDSAQGELSDKNYYRFEELMMDYLGIDPYSATPRKVLKSYIDQNYKTITCPAQITYPKGGMLVNIAASHDVHQLSTFVEKYEIDYSNLEDSEGQKVIPWLENKVVNTSVAAGKETFQGMINYLNGLVSDDDEDSFEF